MAAKAAFEVHGAVWAMMACVRVPVTVQASRWSCVPRNAAPRSVGAAFGFWPAAGAMPSLFTHRAARSRFRS